MADALSGLAREFAEQFVFAKVDIDEQPGLRDQFAIKNHPTLLVFRNGEVELTQEGQMQEEELRVLLKGLGVFRESDELRQQARDKHMAGDTPEAIMLLTQAIQKDPSNTGIAMDMVQVFLDIGELEQARGLFKKLPESDHQSDIGKSLTGQLAFAELAEKTEGLEALSLKVAQDAGDNDARFDLAVCLIARHDYTTAVDHIFTLLENVPDYKDGAAKEMIITIANMLSPNEPELAKSIRNRLGSFLH
jgi:putative thioredoxin